jgi:hypothetical protein
VENKVLSEPAGSRFRLLRLLPVLLLVGITASLGASLVRVNTAFSPVDELQHYDYVTELVYHHRIPLLGDPYNQEALHAAACFRVNYKFAYWPACQAGTLYPPDFGSNGSTTAAGYPPSYYVPTAVLAWGIRAATGAHFLFRPARTASLIWLIVGAFLTYLLARRLRAGPWVAASVALLAAIPPTMLAQGTTVNPDSMSLMAGAGTGLVWLSCRSDPRRRAWFYLIAWLTFVVWIKPNFLAVPVAVAVAEIALAARSGLRHLTRLATWSPSKSAFRVVAGSGIATFLGLLWPAVFIVWSRSAAANTPLSRNFGDAPWNLDQALRTLGDSYVPLDWGRNFFIAALDRGGLIAMMSVIDLCMVAGAIAAAILSQRRQVKEWEALTPGGDVEPTRAIGYLATASLVLAQPVLDAVLVASNRFIQYPSRYSLFIVPLGLCALAGVAGTIRSRVFIPMALLLVLLMGSALLTG